MFNKQKIIKNSSLCLMVMFITNAYGYSREKVMPSIHDDDPLVVEEEIKDSHSLAWIDKIEEGKENVANFFNRIFIHSKGNDAFEVLRTIVDSFYDDCIPAAQKAKVEKEALTIVTQIRDLAKVGNTSKIATLLEDIISDDSVKNYNYLSPDRFPVERKESLQRYLSLAKKSFHIIKEDEDIDMIKAYMIFLNEDEKILNKQMIMDKQSLVLLYDGISTSVFLEALNDLGESINSYHMWLEELHYLFRTLDPANKPRIIELLNYQPENRYYPRGYLEL